ncbi:MAG: hypothetical protein COA50_05845 [Flavobacteriaceae bacterium]|nr:MAG: hypothetical protein COA50_05845 [Flavobacteriaceae bacterium]
MSSPKIHTDLLWDLTCLFIGLGLLYFVLVFYFRNKISSKVKQVVLRKRELSPMISEFLFYEEDANKEEKSNYITLKIEIRELLKNDFNRKVLSEVLLDLQKDVSGNTETRLFKLYQDLGLHLDAYEKLKNWRWEIVSKGISDLTTMQVFDAYGFIIKFINDKRGVIRKQSEIAAVTLKNEGINYFLDTTKYKISQWQQLKMLEVIRNLENFEPPRFKAWLTSSNKDVVLFGLRLIKFYNQNDANTSIIQLIRHRNNNIKEEAINCIKKFCILEAIAPLKLVFWKCKTDIKILILDTIATLGDESDIPFLRMVEKKESNFVITSKVLSTINAIVPETILPTKGLEVVTKEDMVLEEEDVLVNETLDHKKDSPETNTLEKDNIEELAFAQESEIEEINLLEPEELHEETSTINATTEIDFLPHIIADNEEMVAIFQEPEMEEIKAPQAEVDSEENVTEIADEMSGILLEPSEFSKEIDTVTDSVEMDFLPHVIADNEETVAISQEPEMEETKEPEVEVDSEENVTEIVDDMSRILLEPDELSKEIDTVIDSVEMDFLPHIIDDNEEGFTIPQELEMEEIKVPEVKVDSEESFIEITDEINKVLLEPEEINFLPNVIEDSEEECIVIEELNIHTGPLNKSSINIFDNNFFEQDNYNKILLLDTLEDLGSAKELPFLKEIIEKEENLAIKERAMEILNDFSETNYSLNKESNVLENENLNEGNSIFKQLFDSSDEESKLVLLDQILEIGDNKEISFLKTLLNDENKAIRDKSKTVKTELEKRNQFEDMDNGTRDGNKEVELLFPLTPGDEMDFIQTIEYKATLSEEKTETKLIIDKKLIPLEFCFLLDKLDIKLPKPSSILDKDFTFTQEFYKSQEASYNPNKKKK